MDGAFPPVLVWDRPGGVYGNGGVRISQLDENGGIVGAHFATENELIAVQAGHIPHSKGHIK